MARLAIRLLGPIEIKLNGEPVSGLESDKVRALLVFLAVAKALPHRREKLAALLWPDWPQASARANLRRALANLRKALGDRDSAQPYLLVTRQTLQFNAHSDAWVDMIAVTDSLSGALPHLRDALAGPQAIRSLEHAVELYRGEFLEGFSLPDSTAFGEWAMFQQEQLHRQIMDSLYYLASWYEKRGEWEHALQCAWQQLELDCWRETGHRQVMRLLAYSGQRSAALAQYRVCCQVLDRELGVSPEEETEHLYESIRDGTLKIPDVAAAEAPESELAPGLPAFLGEVDEVRQVPAVFVAHERELERLDRLLKKAVSGQGQIIFVTGGPGRGKTALLDEFARRAMDTYPNLLLGSGKCNAYAGVGDPYLPFQDILTMLTGDLDAHWSAGAISRDHALRLWQALPFTVQTVLRRSPQLIPFLLPGDALLQRATASVPDGTAWLHELREHILRRASQADATEQPRLFQQVANVLHDIAREYPLLLILDDLQWVDTASACMLFHLGRQLGKSRILIAGAYRPEELVHDYLAASPAQSSPGERQRHPLAKVLGEFKLRFGDVCIDLAAADQAEAKHFVDAWLDTEPNHLHKGFRDSLVQHTAGHPLFTIEILREMQARGDLVQDGDGCWVEGPALDWQALPARVEGVIEERLARLDDNLREILAVASVEGQEFTAAVLAGVLKKNEWELVHKLSDELERRHRLVQERGVRTVGEQRLTCYRFSHTLLQQYLYNKLGEGQRVILHREIARILEALYEGSLGEIAAQLAFHYAGDVERERYYAKLAGERAETFYAHNEAVRWLSLALELTPESNHAERYALLMTRERAHHHLGDRDLQQQDLATMHELATVLANGGNQAEVALRKSDYARVTGDYVAAAHAARTAVELAQGQVCGPLNQATYYEIAGYLRWGKALLRRGDYHAARTQLERVLTLAAARPGTSSNHPEPMLETEDGGRSWAEPVAGTGRCWRQLEANSHRCLGVVCWHLGDNASAKNHYRQALRICRQTEDRRCQATAINGLGVIAWSEKSPAEAWANFEQALRLHEEVGDRRGQCRALSNLGDVAIYWGDYAEAKRLFAQCLPLCREINEPWIESGVLNNLGVIADRLGTYTEALTRLHQALDMRREIGDRQGEAEGLSDLGLAYHHMGDNESSLDCGEQSLRIIRDLRDPFMLAFVLTRLGHALLSLDSPDEAAAAYREAWLLRKQGTHTHLEVEPLAGLARVALAQGDGTLAVGHVEKILPRLNGDNLDGNDEPLRVYLTCYQVLHAYGDPRAERILDGAYGLLQQRAAQIQSQELQASFVDNIAVHRRIVATWQAKRPGLLPKPGL